MATSIKQWARQIAGVKAAVLLGLLCGVQILTGEPEDELKTATILTFIRNAEWPESGASSRPVTIGVLGRTAQIKTLSRLLEGKSVNNRPIRVLEMKAAPEAQTFDVLYVAAGNTAEIKQALASARAGHVLTIGGGERFLEYGGAVSLTIVDGHMSFEVSIKALDHAGVTISAKLLRYGQLKGKP
jgi:hypothetical protein